MAKKIKYFKNLKQFGIIFFIRALFLENVITKDKYYLHAQISFRRY